MKNKNFLKNDNLTLTSDSSLSNTFRSKMHTIDEDDVNEYLIVEKPYRFVILMAASFLNFSTGFQYNNIPSLSKEIEKNYELTSLQTHLFSNIYMYIYLLMVIPSFYIIEKKSLKFAVNIKFIK